MARRVIEEATCDICGDSSHETYTISHKGRTAVLDVCPAHEQPFGVAMTLGASAGRTRIVPTTGPVRSHSVVPVD